MYATSSSAFSSLSLSSRFSTSLMPLVVIVAAVITTGCGSGGSSPGGPKLSGNTSVTVVLSSTANAQLSQFGIGFANIALTSQSGKTVTLFTTPQGTELGSEFIHVNGGANPFVTVSVPQDIYTAATVEVDQSYFACVTLVPGGGIDTSSFAYGSNPNNAPQTNVTVNLPSPITVTGDSMGLSLDLQVAQSATYSSCYDPNGHYAWSIQPTFNLTPLIFSSRPTNARNGKVTQLEGQITAIATSGSSFTLSLPEGPRTLSISAAGNTAYQGIGSFSGLAVGMFLDMDAAMQPDGSLIASRIAVEDPSAVDMLKGSVLVVSPFEPAIPEPSAIFFNEASQGAESIPIFWPFGISSSLFQISGEIQNLQSLPFVAAFNSSNMVAGQRVYLSSQSMQINAGVDPVATTITLMPQTINGTVVASATSGNFADYTVSLASYDLFPTFAVQPGQKTLLTNPSQVEVYVDSKTQMLNTLALASGSTLRFYGLVFNDNGTLRMDCAQVNDGVTATSQSPASDHVTVGQVRTVRRAGPGKLPQMTTIVTRLR